VEKPTALADNRNTKKLEDFFTVATATATATIVVVVAAATSAIAITAAATAAAATVVAECEDIRDPHIDPSLSYSLAL
jgi:hypothetical protein